MAHEGILRFLVEHGKQGYSIQQMRAHLIGVGQNPREIDEAIWEFQQRNMQGSTRVTPLSQQSTQTNTTQSTSTIVQHRHSLSSGTLILLTICCIAIVIVGTMMFLPKGEEQLLDYTIETTVREIQAGKR